MHSVFTFQRSLAAPATSVVILTWHPGAQPPSPQPFCHVKVTEKRSTLLFSAIPVFYHALLNCAMTASRSVSLYYIKVRMDNQHWL